LGNIEEEKFEIARRHIIPKQLNENGILSSDLNLTDDALKEIIRSYTREAGVRNLEREIGRVCRKVARSIAEGGNRGETVTLESLSSFLGPKRFFSETAERTQELGVATGLAWTPNGGEILFVESTKMKGKKGLTLTGHLGDVMKESAQAALSYVRSQAKALALPEDFFEELDLHIHVPAGSIPKDGPSAGVTIASSLASLLCQKPVRSNLAMTGEITLRGRVLPVGGIKEKVLAAKRAGIEMVILPKRNEKDLEDIPQKVREELRFVFVEHMDEILKVALGQDHKAPGDGSPTNSSGG
jgi:ATP-dependent Lon protease